MILNLVHNPLLIAIIFFNSFGILIIKLPVHVLN
eukprot:SAG31_NODE_21361_length_551_cov_1.588496_1_plen_33_part_10